MLVLASPCSHIRFLLLMLALMHLSICNINIAFEQRFGPGVLADLVPQGPNPLADMVPPGPNLLADLDPLSWIWTPLQKRYYSAKKRMSHTLDA